MTDLTRSQTDTYYQEIEGQVIGQASQYTQYAVKLLSRIKNEEAFSKPIHRAIFNGLQGAIKSGREADLINISKCSENAEFSFNEIFNHLIDLGEKTAAHHLASRYENIEALQDNYLRNKVRQALPQMKADIDAEKPFREVMADHFDRISGLDEEVDEQSYAQQVESAVEEIKIQNKAGGLVGLSWGIRALDNTTGGLQKGHLVIIAGRPSMGKSVLALNAAAQVANKHHTLLFSREMTSTELVKRMAAATGKFRMQQMFEGDMSDAQIRDFENEAKKIAKKKLVIDEQSGNINQIVYKVQREAMQRKLGAVFIDYLQLVNGSNLKNSDTEQLREITRTLKALAKKLNIPIVLLSQLNRDVEQRPNKVPQMSDLKQSGSIEEDANMIILAYRPEHYKMDCFPDGEGAIGLADFIVAKNRNGRTGAVRVGFQGWHARFLDREQTLPNETDPENQVDEPF